MKTIDHKLLGSFILSHTKNITLLRYKKAFLLGCVEPDYNFLTYLRGCIAHKNLLGHHTENSEKHIRKLIRNLCEHGLSGMYTSFVLGTLIHYISDSFTYPHTPLFSESFSYHGKYENKLHHHFQSALKSNKLLFDTETSNIRQLWEESQAKYLSDNNKNDLFEKDIAFILSVCISTVNSVPVARLKANPKLSLAV